MSTTYIHTRIGVIDAAGDTNILYPQNTAQDVSLSVAGNANLPSGLTNVQELANELAPTAFGSEINDSVTASDSTWSSTEINDQLDSQKTTLENTISDNVTIINKSISKIRNPINILTVSSAGVVTSDYGYTLADLHNMLNNADYDDYIKDEDTITLGTTDGATHVLQANIDTYYNYGDTAVPHHIDFISKNLIPGSLGKRMRTTNANNGTASIPNPYLASTESGCVLNYLAGYLSYIPSAFQSYMITKRFLLPSRYSSSGTLNDDNSWAWGDLPKLWIPFEGEVSKSIVWSTKGWNGGCHHYPIFNKGRNIVKLHNGSRANWWLASAFSGNSTHFCHVSDAGTFSHHNASNTGLGVPLCLRFK